MILFIHLKRFRDGFPKNMQKITFPFENLNLTDSNKTSDHASKAQATNYKLYGILHHDGDISQGHYRTEVLNLVDRKWYFCDDTLAQAKETMPENTS